VLFLSLSCLSGNDITVLTMSMEEIGICGIGDGR